jgi:hypothetical protein
MTTDRSGQPLLTREWIDDRVVLFETFCLPSMAGQTCQNFQWLVRFDADQTPADVKERIGHWQRSVNLTPVWEERSVQRIIGERIRAYPSVVLTTRLDSDDALQKEHVAVVQGESRDLAEVLCPTYGYSLQYPEGIVRRSRDHLSAFITLVDLVSGPPERTVRSVMHRDAAVLAPPRAIGGQPLWLQTAHGRNLWNRPHGAPCSVDGVREAFSFASDVRLRDGAGAEPRRRSSDDW